MRALSRNFKTLIKSYPKLYKFTKIFTKMEQEFKQHTCTLHKETALAGQAAMNDLPSSGYHMRQNQIFEILLGLFM